MKSRLIQVLGDKVMIKIGNIYFEYEKRKYAAMKKDFDDLLFDVYRVLSSRDEVREKNRDIFTHVRVDEF
ncbi:MAG: hypothetical protein C4518_06285 [Desulfobacteraceae bacterium]|nr:MAG: hypothetical protein C4518_06285 [Desulfobacteraceae bacterium]